MIFVIVVVILLNAFYNSLRSSSFKRTLLNERFEHEVIVIGLKSKIQVLERSEKHLKKLLAEK